MKVPPLPPEAQRLWKGIYELDCLLGDAVTRLRQVAAGEKVLGYDESAARFEATADEIREARMWADAQLRELITRMEGLRE